MLKKFILNLKFVKEALRQAEIAAFPKASKDVLETMQDDLNKKAEELAKEKLSSLLVGINFDKIVSLDKGKGIVYIGGKRADDSRLSNLKSEAEFFGQSDLWNIISETVKQIAQKSMFMNAESLVDLQKGKSILYTLDSQQNIVNVFKSYTHKG